MDKIDSLWLNARLLVCEGLNQGVIERGALAVVDGRIHWCGAEKDLAADLALKAVKVNDCQGRLLTPALIDCHTHLVYGGGRANEFEMRLLGKTYQQIAKSGGGILSTVAATRKASEQALFDAALPRVEALQAEGVATLEIKSGYGLNLDSELKCLRVARALGKHCGISIQNTLLSAHALPTEYTGRPEDYIDLVCDEILPAAVVQGLVDAVDVFCESIAFNLSQCRRVFETAKHFNLPIKCHADQLSNLGASRLAAVFNALSCDHLEYSTEGDLKTMKDSQTVAVVLPGAFYFLRESQKPPIDLMRKHGVNIAIATDSNPGTSPTHSLLLMLNMACTLFGLTVDEALLAVTINAARALGLAADRGSLTVGKRADFILWDVAQPSELCYYFGRNPNKQLIIAGE